MAAAVAVEADDAPWGLEGFGGGGTTGVVGVFNSRSWAGTGMLINSLLGGANGLSTSVLTSDSSLLESTISGDSSLPEFDATRTFDHPCTFTYVMLICALLPN